jgi:two-component system response regulator AtoC
VTGAEAARRGTILLVEDEPAVARLTELVLVSAGYAVVQANNHMFARNLLAETGFDLVIADTEMGARASGLDGLAELAQTAGSPVLLFSAHRFTQEQIKAAGLAGAIPKPFDIDELLAIVEHTLTPTDPGGNGDTATPSS